MKRLLLGTAGVVTLALVLAGCATGSDGSGPLSTGATSGHTVVPPPLPSLTASVSATPPTLAPSTATARPTHTGSAPAADACTADQLTVRVLPGGAIQGYEIAAVTFINASTRECSLEGYPTVQLLRSGQLLATASHATGQSVRVVHLAPNAQAQAQIRDHSTCQAPLSDTVHVAAPPPLQALTLDRPFQLRGCTVTVDPVSPES